MSVTDDRGNVTHTMWAKIRFVIHCSRRQVFVLCANTCTKDVGRLWNIVASAMLRRLRTGPRPTEQQVLLKSFTHVCVLVNVLNISTPTTLLAWITVRNANAKVGQKVVKFVHLYSVLERVVYLKYRLMRLFQVVVGGSRTRMEVLNQIRTNIMYNSLLFFNPAWCHGHFWPYTGFFLSICFKF